MQCRPSGPTNAKIMIVGEAPGENEMLKGEPFVGASGMELTRMLSEAGIDRGQCFLTNVARERPPGNDIGNFIAFKKKDRTPQHVTLRDKYVKPVLREGYDLLLQEIKAVKPNLIIALGNTALWALTGKWGVVDWRGSELWCDQIRFEDGTSPTVIPTYHPAAVLRQWDWRPVAVHDLKKAARMSRSRERPRPQYRYILRPSFETAMTQLLDLEYAADCGPLWLSVDIETRAGHIACIGFAWSKTEAICIPLMLSGAEGGYWTEGEEVALVDQMRTLLLHPNVKIIGQNFSYDAQYIARHWCFLPVPTFDTLIGAHACFSNLPKSLAFLSSLYCEHHVYWKDDGKTWDASTGEDQLWSYNCEDCCRTFEIAMELMKVQEGLGRSAVNEFQQSLSGPVLRTMGRGVKIDEKARAKFALDLSDAIAERENWLQQVASQPLNPRSNPQMLDFFGNQLRLPTIKKRRPKTGEYTPSFDDESLRKMAAKEPLIGPIVDVIADIRSLGVFFSTFVQAPLDFDGRMRCSYSIGGTVTYRFSSSENAFGSGTNLQNIPKGDD